MNLTMNFIGFPAGGPWGVTNGQRLHHTNSHDLAWAAITVGRKNLREVFRHGSYSWFEVLYRLHMIWANLKTDAKSQLERAGPYDDLDPTEKGAVSYFLGMAMAKLLAADVLGTPWLSHMSAFTRGAVLSPDLIGPRNAPGEPPGKYWVVVEAKGRTGGMDKKVRIDALAQAAKGLNLWLGGARVVPAIRVASIIYFNAGLMKGWWEVPGGESPSQEDDLPRVNIDADEYLDAYYLPVMGLLRTERFGRAERLFDDRVFFEAEIPELDVTVGLDAKIYEQLLVARDRRATSVLFGLANELLNTRRGVGSTVVYPDGVLLELGTSWNEEHMALEPRQRPASST
jgi:hypothetical protein